jgi:hypothetical protein
MLMNGAHDDSEVQNSIGVRIGIRAKFVVAPLEVHAAVTEDMYSDAGY